MGWKTQANSEIFRYGGKNVVPTAQGGSNSPDEARWSDYGNGPEGYMAEAPEPSKAKLPMGYNARLRDIDDERR